MVEGGVEHPELVRRALGIQPAQFAVPGGGGGRLDGLEGLPVALGPEIPESAFHGGGAEGDLDREVIPAFPVEVEPAGEAAAGHFREAVSGRELAPEADVGGRDLLLAAVVFDRAGEADGKIGIMLAGPSLREAVAGQEAVADHAHAGPEGLALVVVEAVGEVQDEVALGG